MRRDFRTNKRESRFKNIIYMHIRNNIKEYAIVSILFIIGIIIGVFFINNISDAQQLEIHEYITSFINAIKDNQEINDLAMLKDSLLKNLGTVFLLWFMGSTVIGISVVYLIVCFRGFVLGYSIASFLYILGIGKGLLFIITSLLLQSILVIPSILALAVSGMKLHNSIMKDRRKENIKIEIFRHTFFSLFILFILALGSLTEVYISKNLLMHCILYL